MIQTLIDSPFKVMCGPRPNTLWEFNNIPAHTFVNLETGAFEWFHGRCFEEDRWAEQYGRRLIHRPITDWPWAMPDRLELLDIAHFIREEAEWGNVYFHCLHGKDRTGLIRALIRQTQQGWSRALAIAEMYDKGFHRFPYQRWTEVL